MDGGEAEKCNEGEGREHLLGSEGAPSCHVYCEHQPCDEGDWYNHKAKVAGSNESTLKDDVWLMPADQVEQNNQKWWKIRAYW